MLHKGLARMRTRTPRPSAGESEGPDVTLPMCSFSRCQAGGLGPRRPTGWLSQKLNNVLQVSNTCAQHYPDFQQRRGPTILGRSTSGSNKNTNYKLI